MRLTGTIAKKDVKELGSLHFIIGHNKVPRVWIVVADKRVAKIYSKAGSSFEKIGEALPTQDTKEKITDEKNRRDKEPLSRLEKQIPYEPSMSPVRRKAFKFAHEIAEWLDKALETEAFDRLIFVAPPQTLGDLRVAASKAVYSRLVAEINKDLTKLDEKDLCDGLNKIAMF